MRSAAAACRPSTAVCFLRATLLRLRVQTSAFVMPRECLSASAFSARTALMRFSKAQKPCRGSRLSAGDGAFPVKGHTVKSGLASVPDCQRIVKKAVADRLASVYGLSRLPETGIKYQIAFFLLNDEASLMIDTSGAPLHKRGYRLESNAAPIRETLAAAMVRMARPRDDVILVDPFCGSGTIAVEAALLADGIAPGLRRPVCR